MLLPDKEFRVFKVSCKPRFFFCLPSYFQQAETVQIKENRSAREAFGHGFDDSPLLGAAEDVLAWSSVFINPSFD